MCSTCAKRGWRDVRAPVRQTGNALGTGEQWLLPPLHSSSGAWLKPCPWFLGDMVRLAPRPHRSFRRPLRRRLFHASAHAPAAAGRAPVDAPSSCTRPLFSPHPLDPTRCHPHRRRRRSPPFARRHGYCTAVVLCGRDVCAVRVYIGGQHLRKSTPFLERRILQVGVFGGSGEHIPSRGRADRCARPVRVWCESFKCSFSSLFLISVRGGPTPAAAWNMTPESGALFGGSLRSSNHTLQWGMLHTAAERETATEGDRGGEGCWGG